MSAVSDAVIQQRMRFQELMRARFEEVVEEATLAILFGHELNAERERGAEIEEGQPRAEREIQLEPRSEPKDQKTT
jgi:hypothetical protein